MSAITINEIIANEPEKLNLGLAPTDPEILSCPHCGRVVRVWYEKQDYRRPFRRVQSLSHALPACPEFRDNDDPDAFLARARQAPSETAAP